MVKILTKLWNGELDPLRHVDTGNPELGKIETLMVRNFETLETICDQQQLDRVHAYKDCVEEYSLLLAEEAFCDGFCLGAKIITEALTHNTK